MSPTPIMNPVLPERVGTCSRETVQSCADSLDGDDVKILGARIVCTILIIRTFLPKEYTMTAPTGRPRVIRNLFPEAPPRPIELLVVAQNKRKIPRFDMLVQVPEPERSEGRVVSLRKNQPFLGCLQKSSHMHRLGLGWQPKNLQKIRPPITRHRRQYEQPSLRSSIG